MIGMKFDLDYKQDAGNLLLALIEAEVVRTTKTLVVFKPTRVKLRFHSVPSPKVMATEVKLKRKSGYQPGRNSTEFWCIAGGWHSPEHDRFLAAARKPDAARGGGEGGDGK